jgi:hypothetical protein
VAAPISLIQTIASFSDSRQLPQVCPRYLQGVDEGDRLEGGVHHHKVQRPQSNARGKHVQDKRFVEEGACLAKIIIIICNKNLNLHKR